MSRKQVVREPMREGMRDVPEGRAVAVGRDGKPVYRRTTNASDPFWIDPTMIEKGWTYEWKRHSTLNQEDPGYAAELAQNGWTPVPAERHPGYFMPADYTGAVIRRGLILMERPETLTQEARDEERAAARGAIASQQQLFGQRVGDGSRVVRQAKGTFTRVEEGGVEITGSGEYDLA